MKTPIRLLIDGRSTWDEVALGYTRIRGILYSALASITLVILTTTGAPWWLGWSTSVFSSTTQVDLGAVFLYLSIAIIFVLGLICVLGLIYLRKRAIRSLNIKYLLHQVSHKARDIHTQLKSSPPSVDLKVSVEQICNIIQDLFEALTGNNDVQVITRVISSNDCGEQVYETLTRTSGLNPSRSGTTEAIPANKGVAAYLKDKANGKGCLLCYDLKQAVDLNILYGNKNVELYPNEIIELMAVGLNAWDGEQESMLGLLYLTSNKKGVIKPKHLDQLCGVADILAKIMSSIILVTIEENKKNA